MLENLYSNFIQQLISGIRAVLFSRWFLNHVTSQSKSFRPKIKNFRLFYTNYVDYRLRRSWVFSLSKHLTCTEGNLKNAVGGDVGDVNSWLHLAYTETESIVLLWNYNMYFSVEYLSEMLQCESYKRRMMAVMSLEVICLANDEYWKCILDAGDVKSINYLLCVLFYVEICSLTLKCIFNCE